MPERSPGKGPAGSPPWVVVKVRDFSDPRVQNGASLEAAKALLGPWDELERAFPGIALHPLDAGADSSTLRAWVDRVRAVDASGPPRDLRSYFLVDRPPEVDPYTLAQALWGQPSVEAVYVEDGRVPGDRHPFA